MSKAREKRAAVNNKTRLTLVKIATAFVLAFHALFVWLLRIRNQETMPYLTVVLSAVFCTALVGICLYLCDRARARPGRPTCDLADRSFSLVWDSYYIIAACLVLAPKSQPIYWLALCVPVFAISSVLKSLKAMKGVVMPKNE